MTKGRFIEKSKNNILSGNIIYVIAPAIPLVIFLILYAIKGIAPFGHFVYLSSDMYHQYCPFFSELSNKFHNGGSLLYSWNIGLGTNFTALYAYYLASPLNFILAAVPHSLTAPFMDILIIVKMMFASLFFTIYASKKFKTKSVTICIFAMFYCMSGYIAAFAWNIMWLDCVAVFPLVMLGLERLVYKKKPFLFIISLGLSVLFNYYIAIMIVMFSIIYFICLLFLVDRKGEKLAIIKRIILFAISGAIAAGLAAVLLLPEIYAFQLSASSSSSFPSTLTAYHSFLQEFSRHMTYSPSYTWLKHYPNIYCGVFCFALLPLYFLCTKIKTKEKIVKGVILGIFLFSFMFNIPEYIWHGFHIPNCLPARQSFIYIFFVLIMGFEAITHFKNTKLRDIIISAEICGAFIILCAFAYHGTKTVADEDSFSYSTTLLLLNAVFLAAYFTLFILARRKGPARTAAFIGFCAVAVTECSTHMFNTGLGLVNYNEYTKNDDNYAQILKHLESENDPNDFYRVDQEAARTANDGSWYNYKSVNAFSSTSTAGVSNFYKSFGTKAAMNSYQRLGATNLLDMIVSTRYTVSTQKLGEDDPIKKLDFEENGLYVYKNEYTLPLGFLIPTELAETAPEKGSAVAMAAKTQNDFFEKATGISKLFSDVYKMDGVKEYTFNAPASGHYYFGFTGTLPEKIEVCINEGEKVSFKDIKKHNRYIDIGYLHEGDSVVTTSEDDMKCNIYCMDTEKLINGYNILKPSGFELTSLKDTEVKGHYTADKSGTYMFSIPYEKGWTVYVDGKQVETSPAMGAFLSISTDKGEHEVEMKYMPQGLMPGVAISLVSVGILTAWMIVYKKKHKGDQ